MKIRKIPLPRHSDKNELRTLRKKFCKMVKEERRGGGGGGGVGGGEGEREKP